MFTLEQKVDLILRYIATNDNAKKSQLKKMVIKALESSDSVPTTIVTVDDLIFDLLKTLGMPQYLHGYEYITLAIKLCVHDPSYTDTITSRLYPDVGAAFDNAKKARVERCIRLAVESTFNNGDLRNIERMFGSTISVSKGKLTNREFIIACTNEITRRMKKLGITA